MVSETKHFYGFTLWYGCLDANPHVKARAFQVWLFRRIFRIFWTEPTTDTDLTTESEK